MSSISATIPENQPLVDFLLEKASTAGPNAAKAYRTVAERVAVFDQKLLGYVEYTVRYVEYKARLIFYESLSDKMRKTVEDFIEFYPMRSEYEKTGDLRVFLPGMRGTKDDVRIVIAILREPSYKNYASPLYKNTYKYFFGYKFNNYSRAWVLAELKKHLRK
jgi:hypothetical protein